METTNPETAKTFLQAIEDNILSDRASEFYSDQVANIEYPNAINPETRYSDAQQLYESSIRGQKVIRRQYLNIVKR